MSWHVKCSLPVALRVSKTRVLKLPNTSQMTSKCGKSKKVALEVITECVTDVLTTFCDQSKHAYNLAYYLI